MRNLKQTISNLSPEKAFLALQEVNFLMKPLMCNLITVTQGYETGLRFASIDASQPEAFLEEIEQWQVHEPTLDNHRGVAFWLLNKSCQFYCQIGSVGFPEYESSNGFPPSFDETFVIQAHLLLRLIDLITDLIQLEKGSPYIKYSSHDLMMILRSTHHLLFHQDTAEHTQDILEPIRPWLHSTIHKLDRMQPDWQARQN